MSDTRIVIGQRGFVWVGNWTQEGDEIVLKNCFNIRRSGTTKGFGELCSGPTPSTTLDPVGTLRLHRLSVVASYDADSKAWEKTLAAK